MGSDDLRSLLAGRSIRVAASECLLGRHVRWNGEHNGDTWPRHRLERLFTLVGICPEVGIGMGVPRDPVQLVGEASAPRVVAVDDPNLDYTDRLMGYASEAARALDDVHGYVFADRSPSCGLAGVKVFAEDGSFERVGRGVYAAAVLAACPDLPVADAETLDDEDPLLDFVLAVLASYGVAGGNAKLRESVRELLNPSWDWGGPGKPVAYGAVGLTKAPSGRPLRPPVADGPAAPLRDGASPSPTSP